LMTILICKLADYFQVLYLTSYYVESYIYCIHHFFIWEGNY